MATTIAKSFIDQRASTDEMIFKSALKRMYGLNAEQMLSYWPTVQNTSEIIKPDGTIALTNEDIRLVKGDPLRTPTGVLEFREASPTENFPIKVPLESVKYDAESFLAAIESNFEEYTVANVKTLKSFNTPKINLLDESEIEEDKENIIVDFRSDPDDKEVPTATKEFGAEAKLLTAVNSAGTQTGISGTIWLVWKGFRYKFGYRVEGMLGSETQVQPAQDVDGNNTVDWQGSHQQVLPPYDDSKQIAGLTNTIAGRNLEVFLKDRGITYTDIKVVPSAVINAIPYSNVVSDTTPDISIEDRELAEEFGSTQPDGFQYNTKEFEYNDIIYEPGDLIKTVEGSSRTLPTNHKRWTSHHPYWTAKPEHKDLTYMPSYIQKNAKTWEGEAVVGYYKGKQNKEYMQFADGFTSNALSRHFMVMRGEWRNVNPFNEVSSYQGTPSSKNPEDPTDWTPGGWNTSKKSGTVMEGFHGNTYKILGWEQMRHMAPGLALQDGDWDLERFIDTFAADKGKNLPYRVNGSWHRKHGGNGSKFAGGDGSNPSDYAYAGMYGAELLSTSPVDHYIEKGRFTWPYDIAGKVNIKANWWVDKRGRGDRGYTILLRIYDSDGKLIKSKTSGHRISRSGTDVKEISLNDYRMEKGDVIHMEIKQDSSKRKVDLEAQRLDVDIFLSDIHDTVELETEVLVAKPAYDNPPGMVTALGSISGNGYMRYIQEGSYYKQPHLEKYNELFSAKTPSSIQKK
tara:strand:+ start:275 stop:2488 length:2214 start_codon:yes stop_codon:yes gene_type:complete